MLIFALAHVIGIPYLATACFLRRIFLPSKRTPTFQTINCWLKVWGTTPKTNMEPKNEGLEDDFPFQRVDFQVPC